MPANITQIRCPNCQNPVQAEFYQLIDVGTNPNLKAHLLSGSLNAAQCPVCNTQWQIPTPLVYHDPQKELLLTYIPVEVGLPKNEQERIIGKLINEVTNSLPMEKRKAYLLQPQSALTFQGLVERILEADGITKEQIEDQKAKMRLLEDILRLPDDQHEMFASEHDQDLDETFFQLASYALQATPDERARTAAAQKIEALLRLTTFGKKLETQEKEIRTAAESLKEYGDKLDREAILDLLIKAPNEDRVSALVSMIRPALDYTFFQLLTEKIDAAVDSEKERLEKLRKTILDLTDEIDKLQEARVNQSNALLQSIVNAKEVEKAVMAALPYIDELFLGILQANIRTAQEKKDHELLDRLNTVDQQIRNLIRSSLPGGLQLAQEIMDSEDIEEAKTLINSRAEEIDEDCLNAMMQGAYQEDLDPEQTARLKQLHQYALRVSMRNKMKNG
ncbi:MAG: CpXC domain-containing protein [Anaerolineales bacterium]|nr:CpXC domain-containing protein [Anaerolineales bacterium]